MAGGAEAEAHSSRLWSFPHAVSRDGTATQAPPHVCPGTTGTSRGSHRRAGPGHSSWGTNTPPVPGVPPPALSGEAGVTCVPTTGPSSVFCTRRGTPPGGGEGREVGDSREGRKKGREEGPPGWGVSGPWPSQAPLLARLGGHAVCGPPPPVGPLPAASNDGTVSHPLPAKVEMALQDVSFPDGSKLHRRCWTHGVGRRELPSKRGQAALSGVYVHGAPRGSAVHRFPASVLAQLP